MNKNTKKILLISIASLTVLSLNGFTPASHLTHHVLVSAQSNINNDENKGFTQAMKSFKSLSANNNFIIIFINHTAQLQNMNYRSGFIKAFYEYTQDHQHHTLNPNNRFAFIKVIKQYLNSSKAFQKGFKAASYKGSGIIPSRYRDNTVYGKGYLIGDELSYDLVNHYTYRPVLRNTIIHYSNYLNSKGNLSISSFISKPQYKAYLLCSRINHYIYEHALDKQQSLHYQEKTLSKHHFNIKHGKQLIYDIQINGLARGSYAKALIEKYPLVKSIYFPKSLAKHSKQLNGIEFGLKDNHATKNTMMAYKTYVSNLYHNHSNKQFKDDYIIKPIDINNNSYDTGCSSIYRISNRRQNKSTVIYIMPYGKQGFIPQE